MPIVVSFALPKNWVPFSFNAPITVAAGIRPKRLIATEDLFWIGTYDHKSRLPAILETALGRPVPATLPGHRAARRAMQTRHAQEHAFWSDEPVYSLSRDRADLFDRGFMLNLICPMKD